MQIGRGGWARCEERGFGRVMIGRRRVGVEDSFGRRSGLRFDARDEHIESLYATECVVGKSIQSRIAHRTHVTDTDKIQEKSSLCCRILIYFSSSSINNKYGPRHSIRALGRMGSAQVASLLSSHEVFFPVHPYHVASWDLCRSPAPGRERVTELYTHIPFITAWRKTVTWFAATARNVLVFEIARLMIAREAGQSLAVSVGRPGLYL